MLHLETLMTANLLRQYQYSSTNEVKMPPTGCSDALYGCYQWHFTFVPIGLYYGKVPSERALQSILYCVTNASLQYSHLCFLGISSVGMYSRENKFFKEKYLFYLPLPLNRLKTDKSKCFKKWKIFLFFHFSSTFCLESGSSSI